MDYRTFKDKYNQVPIIDAYSVAILNNEDAQSMRNQLTRWTRKGLLISLKKGMYAFNKHDRRVAVNELYIANRLYDPSYISLETALSFYGIIPERVVQITSVTTRKTKKFTNDLGTFTYRHLKVDAFRGFIQLENNGSHFFMAERAKAIIDFIYFNLSRFSKNSVALLTEGYRFQELGEVKKERLIEFAECFKSKKLMRVVHEIKTLF